MLENVDGRNGGFIARCKQLWDNHIEKMQPLGPVSILKLNQPPAKMNSNHAPFILERNIVSRK